MRNILGVLVLLVAGPAEVSAQVTAGFDRYGFYRVGYDPYVSLTPPIPASTSFYTPGWSVASPVVSVAATPAVVQTYYTPATTVRFTPVYPTVSAFGTVTVPSTVPVYYRTSFYPTYTSSFFAPTFGNGVLICP